MILDKFVKIEINTRSQSLFEKLGYKIPRYINCNGLAVVKKGTMIRVKVTDLPRYSRAIVKVKCENCGKVRKTQFQRLNKPSADFFKNKKTRCFACHLTAPKGSDHGNFKHGLGSMVGQYRSSAKARGISYNLSSDLFLKLSKSACYYCKTSSNQARNGTMGIDRKDSKKGYEPGNCVPCCKYCNTAKNDMSTKEFKIWIKRIYKHMFVKNVKE